MMPPNTKQIAKTRFQGNAKMKLNNFSRIRDWGWELQACILQRHQQHARHVVHHGGGTRGPLRGRADDFCGAVHGPRQAQDVRPIPLGFVSTLLRLVSK